MWVVPASESGTRSAIAMSTGLPSNEGQSSATSFLKTMTAAWSMAALLACGTAKPSVMPVSPMSSRSRKAA